MKHALVAMLLLTGCAMQLSPEQQQAKQERMERLQTAAKNIRITKEEPQGCEYLTSVRAQEGWDVAPKDYDFTLQQLKIEAAAKGQGNTVVLDLVEPLALHGYRLTGRLFNCP